VESEIDYKEHDESEHVDFESSLSGFYFERCGFAPTNAGLIKLIQRFPSVILL
jgi:hypothetical protein